MLKRKDGFILRQVGQGSILVPTGARVVDMNGLVTLNDTGRFIWEHLDGSHTPAAIAVALASAFSVEETQAQDDVMMFLAGIEQIGLVEHAGTSL